MHSCDFSIRIILAVLVLRQVYNYSSASELTLKDMGKIDW